MNAETPQIATVAARSIGDILVATGRLSPTDAERISAHQKAGNTKFGDAAVDLNVLTREDIDFALSQQFDYAYLTEKDTSLSPELVAAYKPFSRVGENLRAVRSQLMLRWFNTAHHKTLAIVSPGAGEGRSFTSANLAIVFAQHGERTLLVDADLRSGRQHALFKLEKSMGLSGLLAERTWLEEAAVPVPGLPGLSVLPCGAVPPNPQELFGRSTFDALLTAASDAYDVVIIDTPAGSVYADAELIAARAGAALLLARKNLSLMPQVTALSKRLQDSGVAVVGSMLNDA